jgi:energy-coupling factor transporter ATP-binding protein EcfA2
MGQHEGTLEWLWSHEEYRKWSTSKTSRLLYVQGKPGSGKSTLTRYFKDHLPEREPAAKSAIIASFFYSFREGESQKSHYNMLRSILYDVLYQDESFLYHFQQEHRKYRTWLRERHINLDKLHYESLKRILRSIGCHQRKERLYFVIDAVDESTNEDRRNILRLLLELCSGDSCIVKVFVASRPVAELEHLVGGTPIIGMQDVNRSDIQRYVHSSFGPDLDVPEEVAREVVDYILEHAQGVFLWVHLVLGQLVKHVEERGCSRREVLGFLRRLPTELEDMYKLILGDLETSEDADGEIGRQMFEWVMFVRHPLTVDELQHALAIQSSPDISEESFKDGLISPIRKRIIACGRNLLEVKGREGIFLSPAMS